MITALARVTRIGGAALVLTGGWVTFEKWARRTRATSEEKHKLLPGDELVPWPMWQATRAITIHAPRDAVWPWLVQMGYPTHRAGWYTPYWMDRVIFRVRARSADRIIPELQNLAPGYQARQPRTASSYFTVAEIARAHALVLISHTHPLPIYRDVDFSWAFVLEDDDNGADTRLIMQHVSPTPRSDPVRSSGPWLPRGSESATSCKQARCSAESSRAPSLPRAVTMSARTHNAGSYEALSDFAGRLVRHAKLVLGWSDCSTRVAGRRHSRQRGAMKTCMAHAAIQTALLGIQLRSLARGLERRAPRQTRARVLARSLLTVRSMQKSHANPVAVLHPRRRGHQCLARFSLTPAASLDDFQTTVETGIWRSVPRLSLVVHLSSPRGRPERRCLVTVAVARRPVRMER